MESDHTSQQDFGGFCPSAHKGTTPFMSSWSHTYVSNQLGFQTIYALREKRVEQILGNISSSFSSYKCGN